MHLQPVVGLDIIGTCRAAQVSPAFIDVSPTVKIVAGSGKPATFSKGIAINPQPKPPTITNKQGKVVYPPPSPATPTTGTVGNPTTSGSSG